MDTHFKFYLTIDIDKGKSFSEAFILQLVNPQNDERLFIELRFQYKKITSLELGENMLFSTHIVG